MRTLAPSTLLACLALAPAALAQTPPVAPSSPPAGEPAPVPTTHAAEPTPPPPEPTPPTGGPQPTPDVPVAPEPSPPTPPEPAPAPPVPDTIRTPDATTSPTMLGVNVPGDQANAPAPPAKDAWQDGHALGVDVVARGGSRIGAPSFAADTEEKAGLGFGLDASFRLLPEFSFGFGLERMSLGGASATSGQSTVNSRYALTELELGARAYPFRWDEAELFVGLHVGLAWQDVDASGLRPSVNLEPAQVFRCSDTAGPGFAIGAELGGALRLARSFWFVGNVGADAYQLTSDPIGTCAVGIGSITTLSVGAGLLYAFDLGREAKVAAAPVASGFARR